MYSETLCKKPRPSCGMLTGMDLEVRMLSEISPSPTMPTAGPHFEEESTTARLRDPESRGRGRGRGRGETEPEELVLHGERVSLAQAQKYPRDVLYDKVSLLNTSELDTWNGEDARVHVLVTHLKI